MGSRDLFSYWYVIYLTNFKLSHKLYDCPSVSEVTLEDMGKQPAQKHKPWWRHQMETFSALLAFCAGNSPVTGEFPAQRPVTRSFDIFFDLCLNRRLSKQSLDWWFQTPSHPLWHHCNDGFAWYVKWNVICSTKFKLSHKLYDCPSVSEVTLEGMGKQPAQKHK